MEPEQLSFTSERPADTAIPESVRFVQPLWQTALFMVLSFGLYLFPWSYRCWQYCNAAWAANRYPMKRSPLGRSLTFIIPLYGQFFAFYRLAADVHGVTDVDSGLYPGLLNTVFVASWIAAKVLPFPASALAFVGLLACVLTVQAQINRTCERLRPGVMAEKRLSRVAYVGIPIGLLLWVGAGYFVVQLYRLSSGIATIRFGRDVNTSTLTIVGPASRFSGSAPIFWLAELNGRIGETTIHRTLDRQVGGQLASVAADDFTVSDSNVHNVYAEEVPSTLSSSPLSSGTYVLRVWRGQSVIAQGTFTYAGQ